jgi:glyoxylase I family protein
VLPTASGASKLFRWRKPVRRVMDCGRCIAFWRDPATFIPPSGSIYSMQTPLDRPDHVGLSHIGLSVSNLERSISFYCDVLGATLARTPYDGDSPAFSGRMAVVIIGSLILDLFEHSGNGGGQFDPTSTGLDHLALVTQSSEDLQRWTRWLDLQKVQHSEIRTAQGMGSMFDFADPDGIQWEFLYLDPEKLQQLESYAQDSN